MRSNVTQLTVLSSVRDRLRSALGLAPNQCYLSLTPRAPNVPRGGDWWLCITPGEARFPDGEQALPVAHQDTAVVVTIYARMGLDRTDEDETRLLSATRGLLGKKRLVLRALVGHDLLDAVGNTFLRDLLHAQRAAAPEVLEQPGLEGLIGGITLRFGINFDWDLS